MWHANNEERKIVAFSKTFIAEMRSLVGVKAMKPVCVALVY